MLKLFIISQDKNTEYDSFGSALVAAESAAAASMIHPSKWNTWDAETEVWRLEDGRDADGFSAWTHPADVTATMIGTAAPGVEAGAILPGGHK